MNKRSPSPRQKRRLKRLYEKLVRAAERVDPERLKSFLDPQKPT